MYFVFMTVVAIALPFALMAFFPGNENSDLSMFVTVLAYFGAGFVFWLGIAYAGSLVLLNSIPDKFVKYNEVKLTKPLARLMSFKSKNAVEHYYGSFSIEKRKLIFSYKEVTNKRIKKDSHITGTTTFIHDTDTNEPYIVLETKYKSNKLILPFKFKYESKADVYAKASTVFSGLAPKENVVIGI